MTNLDNAFQKFVILSVITFIAGCSQQKRLDHEMDENGQYRQFDTALESNDLKGCSELLDKFPKLLTTSGASSPSLLNDVVEAGKIEFIQMFLDRGFSLAENPNGKKIFLVRSALMAEQFKTASWLLENGCDPNRVRLLIGAINRQENALDWVKLFVDHGADVNWCVRIAGPEQNWATPLDWARRARKQDIVDYLLSKGAVTADDPHTNRRTDD